MAKAKETRTLRVVAPHNFSCFEVRLNDGWRFGVMADGYEVADGTITFFLRGEEEGQPESAAALFSTASVVWILPTENAQTWLVHKRPPEAESDPFPTCSMRDGKWVRDGARWREGETWE